MYRWARCGLSISGSVRKTFSVPQSRMLCCSSFCFSLLAYPHSFLHCLGVAVPTSCHVWVKGCTALVTVLLATLLTALVTGVLTTTQPLAIILTSNVLRNTTPLVHRNIAYTLHMKNRQHELSAKKTFANANKSAKQLGELAVFSTVAMVTHNPY